MSQSSVSALANIVMRGVVNSGVVNDSNIDKAVDVMRAELKAFLADEEYAAERSCILAGTVSEQAIIQSVVASCVLKINGAAA